MWNKKDFEGQRELTINHFKKKGVSQHTISEYCTLAGIPIIVVCEFVMEEMPEHKEMCEQKIKDLKGFYGIKG